MSKRAQQRRTEEELVVTNRGQHVWYQSPSLETVRWNRLGWNSVFQECQRDENPFSSSGRPMWVCVRVQAQDLCEGSNWITTTRKSRTESLHKCSAEDESLGEQTNTMRIWSPSWTPIFEVFRHHAEIDLGSGLRYSDCFLLDWGHLTPWMRSTVLHDKVIQGTRQLRCSSLFEKDAKWKDKFPTIQRIQRFIWDRWRTNRLRVEHFPSQYSELPVRWSASTEKKRICGWVHQLISGQSFLSL